MTGEPVGERFRARAGVLTTMMVASAVSRPTLLELLAEIMLGVKPMELERPSETEVLIEMIADDFLLEAADPSKLEPDGSIGPNTPLRPTAAGLELPMIGFAMDRWLGSCPEGPLELGEESAGVALAALVGGWGTTVAQQLALRPQSLAELCEAELGVQPEVLEARIAEMSYTEQLESYECEDGETRYELTDWTREAIAPLVFATRMECRYPRGDTKPQDPLDVQALFACALPLIVLDPRLAGTCRLAALLPGEAGRPAGVTAQLQAGTVTTVDTRLARSADSGLTGSAEDWLEALTEGDPDLLQVDGDPDLAGAVFEALYERFFAGLPRLDR